jgi:orotate phosphoribosyltransferase
VTPRPLADLQQALVDIILAKGHLRLDEPVQLASGDWSRDFIDNKRAFALGSDLILAGEGLVGLAAEEGWDFDAVGGLTLGADHFSHAVAVVADCSWFVVRKAAKERGTKRRVEGVVLGEGTRVLVVDDVVTRGGSILDAYHAVVETGAEVVGVTAMVDRGRATSAIFAGLGVPFRPLLTYRDLGLDPVGDARDQVATEAPVTEESTPRTPRRGRSRGR